jgi:transposase
VIQITPQMRIWVAVEPADFRRGIDGLAALCRQKLNQEPMSGAVFVFGSRRRKSIKILVYDGQGFVLYQKRLSAGRFGWWPQGCGVTRYFVEAVKLSNRERLPGPLRARAWNYALLSSRNG